jgi:predicted small secreted protein
MKRRLTMSALVLGAILLAGCPADGEDTGKDNSSVSDGINWSSDANDTLTIINETPYDVVLFAGAAVSSSNMIGGIRADSTSTRDISGMVSDFETGGLMVIRGMRKSFYDAHKTNLANARVEYTAVISYGQGKKFNVKISSISFGEYQFRITNNSSYGVELRLNSPDSAKITFIPQHTANYDVFSSSADSLLLYPILVQWDASDNKMVTIRPIDDSTAITAAPRPVNNGSINTYTIND